MHLDLVLHNAEKMQLQTDKNTVVIGRSSKCDIVIPHESMSRQHCKIELIDGGFFVTDLGSSNGVYIDDTKIEPNTATAFQTYFNLSFGFVTSCHISLETTPQEMIAEVKAMSAQKIQPRARVEKEEGQETKTPSRIKSHALNIMAFAGILFAIYYYLTHEKPVANTLESNPQNSEITESDLF